MNLRKIKDDYREDAKDKQRFEAAKDKYADKVKGYVSELSRCAEDKRTRRARVWYKLAEEELPEVAKGIKEAFPDIFKGFETERERDARLAEEKRQRAEQKAEIERQKEEAAQAAKEAGKGYVNYDPKQGGLFSASDKFFYRVAMENGCIVRKRYHSKFDGFDTSMMRRNGRAYLVIYDYEVEKGDKKHTYAVGNMSNEGGGSYGWMLEYTPVSTWKDIRSKLAESLDREFGIKSV